MEPIRHATIVEVYKTNVWIESDLFGARHVVVQHKGCDPFTYASFHYDYRYTDNAGTLAAATDLALQLGATEPIDRRSRELKFPNAEEIKRQIKELEPLLDSAMK